MKKAMLFGATVLGGIMAIVIFVLFIGSTALTGFRATGEDDEEQQLISCDVESGTNNIPAQYREFVYKASSESGIPVSIHAAQIDAESSWNPKAVSHAGAQGLTQFMPGTWTEFGNGGDPFNPEDAIAAQGRYLKHLKDFVSAKGISGDPIDLTLAAYNAGPGNVTEFRGVPPFVETQNYVKKIKRLAQTEYNLDCAPLDQDDIEHVNFEESGKWVHPLPGGQFTSGYGPRPCPTSTCNYDTRNHQGIDFSTGGGGKVQAPVDMEITFAGNNDYWSRWYGTWIIGEQISGEKFVLEFHHCKSGSLKVKKGQKVQAGTQLCIEGSTGNSAGAHLHYQMGKPGIDPSKPTRGNTLDPKPILIAKKVI